MEVQLQRQQPQKAQTDKPNMTGIPTQMKMDFERRSGLSFDDVRVHYNSDQPIRFYADAYTYGTDVYIAPGRNDVLRHELGHVIQQKRGISRHDTTENGVPVSNAPGIEKQADEFGRSFLPEAGLAPLRRSKKISPVVMKAPTLFKTITFPRMEGYFRQQKGSKWKPGRRSTTAYGFSIHRHNQGPHIHPHIMWEVFDHALKDAKVKLKVLAGTRIIPYPKTAVKIYRNIAHLAVLDRLTTPAIAKRRVDDYYRFYLRLYTKKQWRKLIELNPIHTYASFRLATQAELQGKGERRDRAVDAILSKTTQYVRDLPDVKIAPYSLQYIEHKSRKRGKAMEAIAKAAGVTDLSEDSEASQGDSII